MSQHENQFILPLIATASLATTENEFCTGSSAGRSCTLIGGVPIVPKNPDGIARFISIGRLSRPKETKEETEKSLEAIRRENERMLSRIYSGPMVVKYLAEQISGMLPLRQTITELWELVETDEWDAIVAEDLSRVFRNPRWQWAFVQDCVDARIRVIAFADAIDTADENWEANVACATLRHGLMIPDTRRRIKRTATESFRRGGMVMKVKSIYAKVSREEAASGKYGPVGLRIRRLVEFEWVINEIHRRLHDGCSPGSIVAWLRVANIPCGPYAKRWSVKLLRELLCDPILHGTRTFRAVVHSPVFRTGNYRRDRNPTPDTQYVRELAFMSREAQEAMLTTVGWTIDWGGVKVPTRPHPRKGISLYNSYWPGQSTICSACGSIMYLFGQYLRCSNSMSHRGGTCWNHVRAAIAPLRTFAVNWLVEMCRTSESFRDEFVKAAKQQLEHQQRDRKTRHEGLTAKLKALGKQEQNIRRSIRLAEAVSDGELKVLVEDLGAVMKQLSELRVQAEDHNSMEEPLQNYSDAEIIKQLPEVLTHLLTTSYEMAEVMRSWFPRCEIVPVQALDTGQVQSRAKLSVRSSMENYDQLEELVVDLFEPPVHIRLMPEALRLRSQEPRPTLKQIGKALGTSYMTIKRCLDYDRRMAKAGVSEPYIELHEKPANAARWRHGPDMPADDAA